jgi:predicted transcriptional regulator of viral defense system
MKEIELQRYIEDNISELFPNLKLISKEYSVLNRYRADFYLQDEKDNDVFIEIKGTRITSRDVGRLINLFSMIQNSYPPFRNPRMIVIGDDISNSALDVISSYNIDFFSLSQLSISESDVNEHLYKEDLLNVPSPIESNLITYINNTKQKIVDIDFVQSYLKIDRSYASQILFRLERKRFLEKIVSGRYLVIPLEYGYEERYSPMNSYIIGSDLVVPYYFGYLTALRYHGLITQYSPIVYICTLKAKRSFNWKSFTYKFVKVTNRKFFGYTTFRIDGVPIVFSDLEKTILDSFDKVEHSGGISLIFASVYESFQNNFDKNKMIDYLSYFNSQAVIQRFGYCLEFLKNRNTVDIQDSYLDEIHSLLPPGFGSVYLAPAKKYGKEGSGSNRWKIIENVSRNLLQSEMEIR